MDNDIEKLADFGTKFQRLPGHLIQIPIMLLFTAGLI
jgi:hypothetical protein